MMHLGQLHRRVFNFIRCWSLKMAKRFSIAYNCNKNKTKHEMKTVTQKKKTNKKNARNKTRQKKDKLNMYRS